MARGRRKAVTGIVGVFLAALMAAGVVLAPIVPLATLASVAPLAEKPDSPAVNFRRANMDNMPLNYSSIINTLAEALQEHNKTASLSLLEELTEDIRDETGFRNMCGGEGRRGALLNKIKAMMHQVRAGAFWGALRKLLNDIRWRIWKWICCCPKKCFISLDVWRSPDIPEYDEPVVVTVNVTASNEIASVIINYSIGENNWVNETMNLTDGLYQYTIDAQPYNTTVYYKVYARAYRHVWNDWHDWGVCDGNGEWGANLECHDDWDDCDDRHDWHHWYHWYNWYSWYNWHNWHHCDDAVNCWAVSPLYSYTVIDSRPPEISDVERNPSSPNYEQAVTVSANATEPAAASGVELVVLTYWNGSVWTEIPMALENGTYKATIPSLPWGTTVQYKIYAKDYAQNSIDTDLYGYTVSDSSQPSVSDVRRTPKDPGYDETVNLTAKVTEPVSASGVKTVILGYYFDGSEWINVTMTSGSDWYNATIPEMPYGTLVQYMVYAFDNAGNFRMTDVQSYVVTDRTAPEIGIINWSPEEPNATEEVNVDVSVSEPAYASGVKNVTLWFSADGGEWTFAEMTLKDGNWAVNIPGFSDGVNVEFKVEAYDNAGNAATTDVESYVVKTAPPPPEPTPLPSLPLTALIGTALGIIVLAILMGYLLIRRKRKRRLGWPYY